MVSGPAAGRQTDSAAQTTFLLRCDPLTALYALACPVCVAERAPLLAPSSSVAAVDSSARAPWDSDSRDGEGESRRISAEEEEEEGLRRRQPHANQQ
jgi:hypothetical protein